MKKRLLPLTIGILLGSTALPLTLSAAEPPAPPAGAVLVTTGSSLEDFFNATLNNSPDLAIARERWAVGTARKDQATGQILPQVNASGSLSENQRTAPNPETGLDTTDDYPGKRYGVSISQVLFHWQAFQMRRQASLIEDQSEAEYYATLANLLTVIADQYLLVLQAEDALGSVNSELEAMTTQLDQVQSLYDLQLARITDLYETQARLAAIQANKVELESEVTINRENLRATSGIEVGALRRLPEAIQVEPMQEAIEVWLQRTEDNNKELAARQFALQAADKQVSAARGTYMPQVSLVYQYQQSNVGFDNQKVSANDFIETNYVGVNLQVPIFAGGANRAKVREAFSLRNIAEGELRQTEVDLLARTRLAYAQVKTGESRIMAGQVLAESTATSFEAMQRGYELGAVTTVDVLNALRDRFAAERDLQQARYDHIRAQLALRRDSGSLTADDIMDVSTMMNAPAQ
jgi:outer membrane protein